MIHRVVLGSIERFIGILTEHTVAKFPSWLAPVQVDILPISDKHIDAANELAEKLNAKKIRFEIDDSNNTFGKKMREFAIKKQKMRERQTYTAIKQAVTEEETQAAFANYQQTKRMGGL
jgi:threonyl-tRNA synthetase